jgi:TDG/mug DNA glycosylase family protein
VDRRTRDVYESQTETWISQRGVDPSALRRLRELESRLPRHSLVADLGCGPGWFATRLRRRGHRVIAFDVSSGMLRAVRRRDGKLRLVRGDLARLPFADESLGGVWAKNSYIHLPMRQLAPALAALQRAMRPGAPLAISGFDLTRATNARRARGWVEQRQRGEADFAGRLFTFASPELGRDLLVGAGFRVLSVERDERMWIQARRVRTLADFVRPGLRLLVVGLNPSPVAADTGVAFAGASNRFWPAALRAGWVTRDRDPRDALRRGVGFTDLAKRVTAGASALRPREYRDGIARVERLVRAFRPRAVVFVGLDGWRRAVDARAEPGAVHGGFAGRPAYLAPSTSGRNASASLADLVRHFRRARLLAD